MALLMFGLVVLSSLIEIGMGADIARTSRENPGDDGNSECSCSLLRFRILEQIAAQTRAIETLHRQCARKICPFGFDYYPEAESCFKVIYRRLRWSEAGEVCRKVMPGVHLAAITSAAKQRAIQDFLDKEFSSIQGESSICLYEHGGGKHVWTSGQTKVPDRCGTPYYWKTLESVETPFDYTRWLSGEPNCVRNEENCVHLISGPSYAWNDASCGLSKCALCEF